MLRRSSFIIVACFFALTATERTASADGGNFGLGVAVGSPSGITAQVLLSRRNALNMYLGVDTWGHNHGRNRDAHDHNDSFYFGLDYVFIGPTLARASALTLDLYFGLGGYIGSHHGAVLGAHFPLGLEFKLRKVPINIFVEIAADLELVNEHNGIDFDLVAALGFRYYF